MRALVIDDSKVMRSILCNMLKKLGYETTEAGDGKAALEVLGPPGQFDLAMVDWNMPEMNGFEFLLAVRADPERADLCIVMVTTETETYQMTRALAAGANEYVMKPFSREVLAEKLSLLLATSAV